MSGYSQNTSGTTADGILAALTDLVAGIADLTAAVRANTQALAVGQGAPQNAMASPYLDATSGDVYAPQDQGPS